MRRPNGILSLSYDIAEYQTTAVRINKGLHFQLGDYARALELDQQGVQLAQAWNKRPAEISARINVALDLLHLTFAGVGKPDEALTQLLEIQTRIEEESFGFHAWRWRLRILEGQALCSLALGLPQRAYDLAVAGEQLARSTTSRKYIASNQLLLGLALAQMDQREEAIRLIEQATALADAIGYQPLRQQGYSQLALLYRAAGRGPEADASHAKHQQVIATMAAEIGDASQRTAFLQRSQVGAFLQTTPPS